MNTSRESAWDYLDWIAAFSLMLYLSFAAYGVAFALGSTPLTRAAFASLVGAGTFLTLLKFRRTSREG